jgi:hypothetical protein
MKSVLKHNDEEALTPMVRHLPELPKARETSN